VGVSLISVPPSFTCRAAKSTQSEPEVKTGSLVSVRERRFAARTRAKSSAVSNGFVT